jgi:hypothetical protein
MSQKESEEALIKPAESDATLHKAPSMLWFVIPLVLLVLYAVLSR